ncbi:MAG TPA: UDP-glucose--hexose-1-phosphate uridylyltransferase [Candidatus Acidoferrales bacterium]|nr:UDP-glucose--hexose-1-phosphate uridylyltransferase [Candidatus Acidoferrales bacterium]
MNTADFEQLPHRRFNPLTREWVLVSPHRTQRPWQGEIEKATQPNAPQYDPACYLCPGNARAGGARNPHYATTFAFDNDYAALVPGTPEVAADEAGLISARSERGACRVICFSPRHDLTIPRMSPAEIRGVVDAWRNEYRELARLPWVRYAQIFENRGAMMGASNPHPHCQIWASSHLPNEPAKESHSLQAYRAERQSCLFCDYLRLELQLEERIVCRNDAFAAIVPYWAVWPFELLLIGTRHVGAITDLSADESGALADILKRLTTRYDNLFKTSFPYSMGFHQAPLGGEPHPEAHFHAHYYPPLLRSATVRKFMVGYEMLATPQRDITPEAAAARLRDAGETHYLDGESARRA